MLLHTSLILRHASYDSAAPSAVGLDPVDVAASRVTVPLGCSVCRLGLQYQWKQSKHVRASYKVTIYSGGVHPSNCSMKTVKTPPPPLNGL